MTLDSEVLDKLRRLLKDTTALVLADDEPYGTAFFISDELLLTCARGRARVRCRLTSPLVVRPLAA